MHKLGGKLGNVLGSFADGAILFPLIATLSTSSGYSSTVLFISTGLLYIFSGAFFRIPMPVQPLKAIAIAAVVSGANFIEVRVAGAMLGGICVLFLLFRIDRLADRIPTYFVHGIQLGLGLMLIRRALEILVPILPTIPTQQSLILLVACCACWVLSRLTDLPMLGFLAAGGALIGITKSAPIVMPPTQPPFLFRWEMVLALTLPQVVLTSANSIIATRDVANRYFGKRAERVTLSRLLASIGFGNIITAAIGGLPFCHGSGGMTAHVRGGSTTSTSNNVIGLFLLGLAFIQVFFGRVELGYPPVLLAVLLGAVGVFHIQLALPTWKTVVFRPILIVMGSLAMISQNLIFGLVAGVLVAIPVHFRNQRKVAA